MNRILIFAQIPPPVHGQSVMTGHLLDGLRDSGQCDLKSGHDRIAAIAYYHLNPRISEDLGDIGRWRPSKIFRIFGFILEAFGVRFRYGVDTLYFIPARPRREGMYRDWCVLFFCRLFFRRLILHWHCIGQPEFIRKISAPERALARLFYGRAALSIALSNYSRDEATYFNSRQTVVVPNGIPDPCPDFDAKVWPERQKRAEALAAVGAQQASAPLFYEMLFVSGRMTSKGLFDAMAAAIRANCLLAEKNVPLRMRLTVAGSFSDEVERLRFETDAQKLNATQLPGRERAAGDFRGLGRGGKEAATLSRGRLFYFSDDVSGGKFWPRSRRSNGSRLRGHHHALAGGARSFARRLRKFGRAA